MSNERHEHEHETLPEDLLALLGDNAVELSGPLGAALTGTSDEDELRELAWTLGEALFDGQGLPDGLEEGQNMALVVKPDMTSERVVYTNLDSLVAAWGEHLGAVTERDGAGVVALETEGGDITFWARTWEPGEYELDNLEANTTAGFLWWMGNEHKHLPMFGPVMLTGAAHREGVHGLRKMNLTTLEEVASTELKNADDQRLNREELIVRFRQAARSGLMFQDAQMIREHSVLTVGPGADPRNN